MPQVYSLLVCTSPIKPGVVLAASWDGGRNIHVEIDVGGQSTAVTNWPIWNEEWDTPLIEASREAFARYVSLRLREPGLIDSLYNQVSKSTL